MTIDIEKERADFEAWWKVRCEKTWRSTLTANKSLPVPKHWGDGLKRDSWEGWQARAAVERAASAPPVILPTDALITTARAVLRQALDDVQVHVCDEHDDTMRAKQLYGPMADLYAAVSALQEGSEQPPEHQQEGQPAALCGTGSQQESTHFDLALDTQHSRGHAAADAFWQYWRENGETHKRGYYESTWGAINRAIRMVGVRHWAAPVEQTTSAPGRGEQKPALSMFATMNDYKAALTEWQDGQIAQASAPAGDA